MSFTEPTSLVVKDLGAIDLIAKGFPVSFSARDTDIAKAAVS